MKPIRKPVMFHTVSMKKESLAMKTIEQTELHTNLPKTLKVVTVAKPYLTCFTGAMFL